MHYISIGSNCDTALYLRKHNIRHEAYPFDWVFCSLESVYNLLLNNFEDFMNDLYIDRPAHKLYNNDIDHDDLNFESRQIYPVICKRYNVLFPHDFDDIDNEKIEFVRKKYNKRIARFKKYINSGSEITLVYCKNNLNTFQKNIFSRYNDNIIPRLEFNDIYIEKIKNLFKDKPNIKIISLAELNIQRRLQ